MAYDEWGSQFQDVFDSTPGSGYLNSAEFQHATALFEAGFTHTGEEYDAMGLSPDQVGAIRDEFYDYMGISRVNFDWSAWREAMGYP